MRLFWTLGGLVSLGLGIVGIALPLLPTVPLVLLAAFCFSRSSERLHTWLVEHRIFGPSIRDWRERGAISLRGKLLATLSIAAVFGISLWLNLRVSLLAIQGVTLLAVLTFIWSRPMAPKTVSGKARRVGPANDTE